LGGLCPANIGCSTGGVGFKTAILDQRLALVASGVRNLEVTLTKVVGCRLIGNKVILEES
jgi:hypothetical protein